MAIILKQVFPLVCAALLLVVSPEAVDAVTRGVRGSKNQQLDSIATSTIENENSIASERELMLKKRGKNGKCDDKKGKDKKKCDDKMPKAPGAGGNIAGRFDIPATVASPAPAPTATAPTVGTWINGCTNENRAINTCTPITNYICKSCLFALSSTSYTPATASSGVEACARDYCTGCSSDELAPFFECGWKISNPNVAATIVDAADGVFPASSIRTPPPVSNVAEESAIEEVEEDLYDTVNCPAIYPRSGTDCTMIDGFEYKVCQYNELGPDVTCQCSRSQTIWSCTGTIIRNGFVAETEDLKTNIEEENELQVAPLLPGLDVVVSRAEDSASELDQLCPVETPIFGTPCSSHGFYAIECCYNSMNPVPETLGTVTCACYGESWNCKGGSLSTCEN